MIVLGIHGGVTALQHDVAAAIVIDGKIIACAEEERFSRVKKAPGNVPVSSIAAVLKEAGITLQDVDVVAHPGEIYVDLSDRIRLYLKHYFNYTPEIRLINHQLTHLASAYYCSGYDEAMVLSYDGFGDDQSLAMGTGSRQGINITETRGLSQSLGNMYAAVTSFLGFKPNEDEFKVMGLAPDGEPGVGFDEIIKVTQDDFEIVTPIWEREPRPLSHYEPWFGDALPRILGSPRHHSEPLSQHYRNVAYAVQDAHERAIIAVVTKLHEQTGMRRLCMAGGCALNCSANGKIAQLPFIDEIFVQPAAGDQGTALGAALVVSADSGDDCLSEITTMALGPSRGLDEIIDAFLLSGLEYSEPTNMISETATMLADGKIVCWFQGRSEFGPRSLGQRSILANPGLAQMKDEINKRVKFREEFRPFAPAVKADKASDIFELEGDSPFMTVAYPVLDDWKLRLPAITHANGTGRVQTVSEQHNPMFYELISEFEKQSDIPVLLNTSFNIKGQPMVETPLEAISTFASTGVDALAIGPFIARKANTPRG